jgi:lipoprotein-releasing system ATP-binding protein
VAEALVIVENLTKSFQHMGRTLEVLRGIDLNIYGGEILCIVGPSGAGKSTLLHCIGTLDLPTGGRIRLGGEELTTLGATRLAAVRNQTIGFVFQFHHLLPEFDALENVMMPGLILGKGRKELTRRAAALLEEVGLAHRGTHRPGELSGGEQQRVAIARALINDPLVLIADEPTGNLDPDLSAEILQIFAEANLRGSTVLVATHDRDLIRRSGRRTITLEQGRIGDEKARVLEAPAVREGLFGIGAG